MASRSPSPTKHSKEVEKESPRRSRRSPSPSRHSLFNSMKYMNIEKKEALYGKISKDLIKYIILDAMAKTLPGINIVSDNEGITYPVDIEYNMYSKILDMSKGKNICIEFINYEDKWSMFSGDKLISDPDFSFETLFYILDKFNVRFYTDEFTSSVCVPTTKASVICLRKDLYIQTSIPKVFNVEYKADWFSHSTPIACRIIYDQFLEQKSDLLEFTIETSDLKIIKVHKKLLQLSASGYLKTLSESMFSESTDNRLKLDYPYSTVMFYLKYLYMGDSYLINFYDSEEVDMTSCLKFGDYVQDLPFFNTCVRIIEYDSKYTNLIWSMRNTMSNNSAFQSFIQLSLMIESKRQEAEEKGRRRLSSVLRDPAIEPNFEFFGVDTRSSANSTFKYQVLLVSEKTIQVYVMYNHNNNIWEYVLPSTQYLHEVRNKIKLLFKNTPVFRDIKISSMISKMKFLSIEV
jgi:hypothetical protein